MTRGDNKVTFYFAKLHKSCCKGKPPPSLTIIGFPEDPQLCVIETLDTYPDRTKDGRLGKSYLLSSFQKPYKKVLSNTISGWIKNILRLAKIGTDICKAHSTLSVSSANVKLKGVSLVDILKRGSWSRKSTWQRFYNEDVACPEYTISKYTIKTMILRFKRGRRGLGTRPRRFG